MLECLGGGEIFASKVMGERGEWRDVADNISPCKSCES